MDAKLHKSQSHTLQKTIKFPEFPQNKWIWDVGFGMLGAGGGSILILILDSWLFDL
ncbi:MAG: hypothetical protein LBB62_04700 [Proteiniphilum sp.]|jgi:hypothetical protein|nr:hypothetical protein [Proteiniphilum sp.]